MIPSLLTSYTDKLSYRPGEPVSLQVSNPTEADADIRLVRVNTALDSVPTTASDPLVAWDANGSYRVSPQEGHFGSFLSSSVTIDTAAGLTVGVYVRPGRLDYPEQRALMWLGNSATEVEIALDHGVPVLNVRVGDARATVRGPASIALREWALVVGAIQADGTMTLFVQTLDRPCDRSRSEAEGIRGFFSAGEWQVGVGAAHPRELVRRSTASRGRGDRTFTGKIDTPFVAAGSLAAADVDELAGARDVWASLGAAAVGCWDLSPRVGPADEAPGFGGTPTGVLVNAPTRGVTGRLWNAEVDSFLEDPAQYSAVHFHDTDVADAGWEAVVVASLPEDLPSGLYGLRITTDSAVDTVPFTVLPAARRAPVLVVLPTFTYLAYANESIFEFLDAETSGSGGIPSAADLAHVGNPSFGLSQYDSHSDGSGVSLSSASRPIPNMRADYKHWLNEAGRHLSAELYLLEWLEKNGVPFDVITDFELATEPDDYLGGARVVITGSHPEYTTRSMLDGLERFRDAGGNIMYLGGNGFYWVTGLASIDPVIVEIRRGHAGVCAWKSEPGEVWLTSTREKGGLWRFRGRSPQRLAGLGMAAQGWGGGGAFARTADSYDDSVSWIFEGVNEDPLGSYGRVMGAAVGDEIDRADTELGTPADATVLASSVGLTDSYQRAIEEIRAVEAAGHGPSRDEDVRADIVYFEVPGGGRVFSAGSIAFSGSLLHNEGDNGISRMTLNVLQRFMR